MTAIPHLDLVHRIARWYLRKCCMNSSTSIKKCFPWPNPVKKKNMAYISKAVCQYGWSSWRLKDLNRSFLLVLGFEFIFQALAGLKLPRIQRLSNKTKWLSLWESFVCLMERAAFMQPRWQRPLWASEISGSLISCRGSLITLQFIIVCRQL